MSDYPRTLVDMTHAPYHPVASRIVDAINYAAAYEDQGLADANDEILDYWQSLPLESRRYAYSDDDAVVDRIEDILSDHGYSLSVAEDYPGLWVIDRAEV